MAMIGKVRRMFFREKKSVREIVRLTRGMSLEPGAGFH
jgi:hypothetical protein